MWLGWQPALGLAAVLALTGWALRRTPGRRGTAGAFAREAALVLALYAFWRVVMRLRSTRLDEGLAHGRRLHRLEEALGIANEAAMAHWLLEHPVWAQAANAFYAIVHVPALIGFLVWLFLRHRDRYPHVRNTVAALTGICLVLHWFPVAPPRMYPDLGFVDVARHFGQSVYGPVGQGVSNQVSALPSLHAGWAFIVAYGVIVAGSSRWRWWILAHPVVTLAVIAATANHWWLDSVAAGAVLGAVLAAQWGLARLRAASSRSDDAGTGAPAEADGPAGVTDDSLEPTPA